MSVSVEFSGRHLQEAINSWDESAAANVSHLASCLRLGFHKFMTHQGPEQLFFFFRDSWDYLCFFVATKETYIIYYIQSTRNIKTHLH